MFRLLRLFTGCAAILCLMACNGIFDDVYDDPVSEEVKPVEGELFIDASSWTAWYYVSFDSLQQYIEKGDTAGLIYAQTHFTPYTIELDSTGTGDATVQAPGIYTYWFDVFGKGMSNYQLRSYRTTKPQAEPAEWDIAFHRQNVRTNGATVLETNYTSFDELPASSAMFTGATFTGDEWSERDVWADSRKMLLGLMGCQGININKPLSSMLQFNFPPSYVLNNHIFLVKLKNGNMAAMQLANYMNAAGQTCRLTINYKYPY